jgi:glyoxylase-like metal-dependent hydrolase (beta-lactamase superfamily II)
MTLGEFLGGHALWNQLPGYNVTDMVAQFRQHGLDEERCQALASRGNAYRRGVPVAAASYRRLYGDTPGSAAAMEVITGYGHSPEHMLAVLREAGVLISGDMLLPRISTNVSVLPPRRMTIHWAVSSIRSAVSSSCLKHARATIPREPVP